MKLGPEHIGKRVRRIGVTSDYDVDGTFACINQDGDYLVEEHPHTFYVSDSPNFGTWELVEENPLLNLFENLPPEEPKVIEITGPILCAAWKAVGGYQSVEATQHFNAMLKYLIDEGK